VSRRPQRSVQEKGTRWVEIERIEEEEEKKE